MDIYRKLPLDNKTAILWEFRHRSGSGADFNVKVVLPFTKSDNKKVGWAKISVDGKKNAIIHDILVEPPYRCKGIGSKMLKFIVDYLQEGFAETIKGSTKGIDDQQRAIKFYLKNGFNVDTENSEFSLTLKQMRGEFNRLYNREEVIKSNEYLMF